MPSPMKDFCPFSVSSFFFFFFSLEIFMHKSVSKLSMLVSSECCAAHLKKRVLWKAHRLLCVHSNLSFGDVHFPKVQPTILEQLPDAVQ